jgi:hypothetical protein
MLGLLMSCALEIVPGLGELMELVPFPSEEVRQNRSRGSDKKDKGMNNRDKGSDKKGKGMNNTNRDKGTDDRSKGPDKWNK